MRNDFKIGDVVKCINPGSNKKYLKLNCSYTVRKITNQYIFIFDENSENDGYFADRFVLDKEGNIKQLLKQVDEIG